MASSITRWLAAAVLLIHAPGLFAWSGLRLELNETRYPPLLAVDALPAPPAPVARRLQLSWHPRGDQWHLFSAVYTVSTPVAVASPPALSGLWRSHDSHFGLGWSSSAGLSLDLGLVLPVERWLTGGDDTRTFGLGETGATGEEPRAPRLQLGLEYHF